MRRIILEFEDNTAIVEADIENYKKQPNFLKRLCNDFASVRNEVIAKYKNLKGARLSKKASAKQA